MCALISCRGSDNQERQINAERVMSVLEGDHMHVRGHLARIDLRAANRQKRSDQFCEQHTALLMLA